MEEQLVSILTGIKSDLGELRGTMSGVKTEIRLGREEANRRIAAVESKQKRDDWLHTVIVLPLSIAMSLMAQKLGITGKPYG